MKVTKQNVKDGNHRRADSNDTDAGVPVFLELEIRVFLAPKFRLQKGILTSLNISRIRY